MPDTILRNPFSAPEPYFLRAGDQFLDLGKPVVMGILNLSPDSFFSASRAESTEILVKKAASMLEDGAGILDLGALSSRPGSSEIRVEEEVGLLIPGIRAVKNAFPDALLSADVYRAEVARAALSEGVGIINNIAGIQSSDELLETIAANRAACILMHSRGDFSLMHQANEYSNLATDVASELKFAISRAQKAGVSDIIADPGFGFSKNVEQNFRLFRDLKYLHILDCPLLAGISRKSMVYRSLDCGPEEALNGSTALHMAALMQGIHILRVHDVKEAREVVTLFEKLCSPES